MRVIFIFLAVFFYEALAASEFSANFEQKVKKDNAIISYSGYLILGENAAFWHYLSPSEKKVYIRGKELALIEPDLEQVSVSALKEELDISKILEDAKELGEGKYLASVDEREYEIEEAKKPGSKASRLGTDSEKISITYLDELENKTHIDIFDIEYKSIPASAFEPVYPKGYDFIVN